MQKINQLEAQARGTQDLEERTRFNLEAIRWAERFVSRFELEKLARKLFEAYLETENSEETKRLAGYFGSLTFRRHVSRYLEKRKGTEVLNTTEKTVQAFAVSYKTGKRVVLLYLDAIPPVNQPDKENPKIWGYIAGDESIKKIFGNESFNDQYSNFQVMDAKIFQENGKKEAYGLYPMFDLRQKGLRFGVPSKEGIQILELQPGKGKMASHLSAVFRNERLGANDSPLELLIEKINAMEPNALEEELTALLELKNDRAEYLFTSEGMPAAITFIAAVAPKLLPRLEAWGKTDFLKKVVQGSDVEGQLSQEAHEVEVVPGVAMEKTAEPLRAKNLFLDGKTLFHLTSKNTSLVISKSIGERHLFIEVQFSPEKTDQRDRKVVSWVKAIDELEWDSKGLYAPFDLLLERFYRVEQPSSGTDLRASNGEDGHSAFHVGIPLEEIREGANVNPPRVQFIEMRRVNPRSEIREQTANGIQRIAGIQTAFVSLAHERAMAITDLPPPIIPLAVRSLNSQAVATLPEIKTVPQLLAKNKELGGSGDLQGFEGVTEKITDGIVSLVAHTFNASEIAVSLFPVSLVQKAREAIDRTRFAAARRALGVKTAGISDAFILAPELALDLGLIAAMRSLFGDIPIVVLVRNAADRGFLETLNIQLAKTHRPQILTADTLDEERKLLDTEAASLRSTGGLSLNLKALAFASEPLATALKEQLPDTMLVTSKMFKNFLNLAGERINTLIAEVRAQFAMARSA